MEILIWTHRREGTKREASSNEEEENREEREKHKKEEKREAIGRRTQDTRRQTRQGPRINGEAEEKDTREENGIKRVKE